MRSLLVHAHADIGHAVVWKTVTAEIPTLLASLIGESGCSQLSPQPPM
jgi:uncharacterized protein with HEPN domain